MIDASLPKHHCRIRAVAVCAGYRAVLCWWVLTVVGKSEFGLYGVVGGMTMIELLAGTMRRRRGRIAAVEDDMRQTYTVKHIRKGLTLLS